MGGGDRQRVVHTVHPIGGDHRPGVHPAAVYSDDALLSKSQFTLRKYKIKLLITISILRPKEFTMPKCIIEMGDHG